VEPVVSIKIHSQKIAYIFLEDWKNWRALGTMDGEGIVWFWIGSHEDYNNLIKSFSGR
tara:strand:- start:301 stop:474 length:174 start_codon:yes stop_codon:yes gene_type:complete